MALIQAYGLFWNESDVYWGQGRQAGSLLGRPFRARTASPSDFREQIGIYVLSKDHDIVYVAQAGAKNQRLFGRLRSHRKDTLGRRWNKFSWFGLRRPLANGGLSTENLRASASRASALNHIEAVLIATSEPTLNRQGGRFGKQRGILRYAQVRDSRLGPTRDEMLRAVYNNLGQ